MLMRHPRLDICICIGKRARQVAAALEDQGGKGEVDEGEVAGVGEARGGKVKKGGQGGEARREEGGTGGTRRAAMRRMTGMGNVGRAGERVGRENEVRQAEVERTRLTQEVQEGG